MPDDYTDDADFDDEHESGPKGLRDAKKAAERRAREAEEALAAAQADQKELAFLRAGLPEDSKMATYFRDTYTGPLTADAIKSAAQEAGVLPEADATQQQSIQGQAQMAAAMTGGETYPMGTTYVGAGSARQAVPAEEAEMWGEFEARIKSGDMYGAGEVLRQHGRSVGVETEPIPGGTAPVVTPLNR